MMPKISFTHFRKMSMILLSVFLTQTLIGQIPAGVEADFDRFNKEMLSAFKIIASEDGNKLQRQFETITPQLRSQAIELSNKLNELPDLSEEELQAFHQQNAAKAHMQEMMALLTDSLFQLKVRTDGPAAEEYQSLMEIMNLAFEDREDDELPEEKVVCEFTVGPHPVQSGQYVLASQPEEAVAFVDELGNLFIEIFSTRAGVDITVAFFIEGSKTGRQPWVTEGQFIIQGFDEEGETKLSLYGTEGNGYIQVDQIGEAGELVTGSFDGKFLDEIGESTVLVPAKGTFRVIRSPGMD